MIGLPGSGKSTWVERFLKTNVASIISSDDRIEEWARQNGLTYNQAFRNLTDKGANPSLKSFETEMFSDLVEASARGEDIIVDRTNLSEKSRRRFLSRIPASYRRVAVTFDIDRAELDRRLNNRSINDGKTISASIVDGMAENYSPPSLEEFDAIVTSTETGV